MEWSSKKNGARKFGLSILIKPYTLAKLMSIFTLNQVAMERLALVCSISIHRDGLADTDFIKEHSPRLR